MHQQRLLGALTSGSRSEHIEFSVLSFMSYLNEFVPYTRSILSSASDQFHILTSVELMTYLKDVLTIETSWCT